MKKVEITPCLWFADNNCEEAVNYYVSVFPDSGIESLERYPDESENPHFEGMSGKIITAVFYISGNKFIALDGGPYFRINESVSFTIECDNQEEIDYYWGKLSHVRESEQCGWCKDKFGVSWQIVPKDISNLLDDENARKIFMDMKKIEIETLEKAKS